MRKRCPLAWRVVAATLLVIATAGLTQTRPGEVRATGCGGLPIDTLKIATLQNVGPLQRWLASLRTFFADRMDPQSASDLKPWLNFLEGLRELPRREQAVEVNRYLNSFRYASDMENFGEDGYWATPEELWTNGSGDCDDFAVAKYLSLRELGFSPRSTWIVLLIDIERDQAHAVVQVRLDGVEFVLDYPQAEMLPWDRLPQYRPILMMNEFDYHLLRKR